MKTINRILTVFMVLSILLCGVATLTSYAANDNQSDSESKIEELQPLMASGCYHTDYYYYNNKITMEQLAYSNKWTLVYYHGSYKHARIYSNGTQIGRYDITSSTNQDPHFHLFSEASNIHHFVWY